MCNSEIKTIRTNQKFKMFCIMYKQSINITLWFWHELTLYISTILKKISIQVKDIMWEKCPLNKGWRF
jgi:hypothetical protein